MALPLPATAVVDVRMEVEVWVVLVGTAVHCVVHVVGADGLLHPSAGGLYQAGWVGGEVDRVDEGGEKDAPHFQGNNIIDQECIMACNKGKVES